MPDTVLYRPVAVLDSDSFYLVFNVTNIYILVITISLAAIISTFDYPSEQSIITRVVPKEHLGYASGMGETRESTANLLGGPVAGSLSASRPCS